MLHGIVEGIYIAHLKGESTLLIEQAHLVPGKGIVGDRYFSQQGMPPDQAREGRQVTLMEMEAVESMLLEDGIQISPAQTRRNVFTRGIALNDLVGKSFYVGPVQLFGVRLCEPCQYLAERTDPRVITSMSHRGGLRAEILSEGIIHIDDSITAIT